MFCLSWCAPSFFGHSSPPRVLARLRLVRVGERRVREPTTGSVNCFALLFQTRYRNCNRGVLPSTHHDGVVGTCLSRARLSPILTKRSRASTRGGLLCPKKDGAHRERQKKGSQQAESHDGPGPGTTEVYRAGFTRQPHQLSITAQECGKEVLASVGDTGVDHPPRHPDYSQG